MTTTVNTESLTKRHSGQAVLFYLTGRDVPLPSGHRARKLRIQYPGAIYHVMKRGDHSEAIFQDDQDRLLFLKTLGEVCAKTDWAIHERVSPTIIQYFVKFTLFYRAIL